MKTFKSQPNNRYKYIITVISFGTKPFRYVLAFGTFFSKYTKMYYIIKQNFFYPLKMYNCSFINEITYV